MPVSFGREKKEKGKKEQQQVRRKFIDQSIVFWLSYIEAIRVVKVVKVIKAVKVIKVLKVVKVIRVVKIIRGVKVIEKGEEKWVMNRKISYELWVLN